MPQEMTTRTVSLGHAVTAMPRNGLGFVQQPLSLVPRFFQQKPTERLVGPGMAAADRNDDVLGRSLDALYASGVTPSIVSLLPVLPSAWASLPSSPFSTRPVFTSMAAL